MRKALSVAILFVFACALGYAGDAEKNIKNYIAAGEYENAAKLIPQLLQEDAKDYDAHILAGNIYYELDQYQQAYDMYVKAYDLDDENEALQKQGLSLAKLGKFQQAVAICQKAIKDNKKSAPNYLALAKVYLMADSSDAAKLAIARARDLDNKNPEASILMGELYYNQKVYEMAVSNLTDALALDPKNVEARTKKAQSLYYLANRETDKDLKGQLWSDCVEEWNGISELEPNNARAWFEQGKIFFYAKDWSNSAKALNNFVRLRPSGSLGRWWLAQSLIELGQCKDAREHLITVANELDSAKNQAKLKLADCYLADNMMPEAIKTYEELAAVNALPTKNRINMFKVYWNLKDTVNAIAAGKRAIDNDPAGTCDFMFQFGSFAQGMKKYDDAIYVFKKRLETCKDSLEAKSLYSIGLCLQFSQRSAEAVDYFERAYNADNNMMWAKYYKADAFFAQEQFSVADSLFLEAITLASRDKALFSKELYQMYTRISILRQSQKKYKDLEIISKQWVADFPDRDNPYLYLGVAYHSQKNVAAAAENYRKALQINPKNEQAEILLKRIK